MEVNRKRMEELARLVGEILREADAWAENGKKTAEEAQEAIRIPRRIP